MKEEDATLLTNLFAQGLSLRQLSLALGWNLSTTGTRLRRLGLSIRRRDGYYPRKEAEEILIKRAGEGYTPSQVASELHWSESTVVVRACWLGIYFKRARRGKKRAPSPALSVLGTL